MIELSEHSSSFLSDSRINSNSNLVVHLMKPFNVPPATFELRGHLVEMFPIKRPRSTSPKGKLNKIYAQLLLFLHHQNQNKKGPEVTALM